MRKTKRYRSTKFSQEAIKEAISVLSALVPESDRQCQSITLDVSIEGEKWHHDSSAEFFADYLKDPEWAEYSHRVGMCDIYINYRRSFSEVSVGAWERPTVEAVHQVFERWALKCIVPNDNDSDKESPIVFIGHGRSQQWRDLKDHLQDKHGYMIEAYEVGARAGHAIRDILEDMMEISSIAILVMTGEDKDKEGNLHARENVIHELGLFQGKLGFPRAVILLEDGTTEFSNIQGIHQIRYSKNNIKETFGEVLATLRREFETDKGKME